MKKFYLIFFLIFILQGCDLFESENKATEIKLLPTEHFIKSSTKLWRDTYPDYYKEITGALTSFQSEVPFSIYDIHPTNIQQLTEIIINEDRNDVPLKQWSIDYSGVVYFTYKLPYEELIRQQQSAQQKADDIIKNEIKASDSEYKKVKALHDYIVKNTTYDLATYEHCDLENCEDVADPYSAYGLLENGTAVCSGYTNAFTLLLDKAGIENYVVTGTIEDGGGHAWNIVKIDDAYYHIDTTWDDPVPNRGDQVQYDYFLVPDSKLKGRNWNPNDFPAVSKKAHPKTKFNFLFKRI